MKFLLILFLIGTAFAVENVAVLEVIPNGDIELSVAEFQYLTDELRSRAVSVLPSDKFTVLTRDGIFALIPPDEKEAECLAEGCAVDIGRTIGAEYVAASKVGFFGGQLTITVELYESMGGKLLGSFVGESDNIRGLLNIIRSKAPDLFQKMLPATAAISTTQAASDKPIDTVPTAISPKPSIPTFQLGVVAKGGFAKMSVKDAKSGFAYSVGGIVVKNFGILDFAPEVLFSSEEYEINEKSVSKLSVEIPLKARVVLAKSIGISLGAVAGLPLSLKIEDETPKDAEAFGIAAIGGLSYIMTENIFIEAVYEKYFSKTFKSLKDSNTDKALCGISYLF